MTYEIVITGAVQGVGYRPFVARLAEEMNLKGEVRNDGGIVRILVSDDPADKESNAGAFPDDTGESPALLLAQRLQEEAPEGALVLKVDVTWTSERHFDRFRIVESSDSGQEELAVFPPDLGLCSVCEEQMLDPADRRFRYPLISCASCGPRWSILRQLPYDRETTAMEKFEMCSACETEYTGRMNRLDRRRHAQTISCHDCGPQMILRLPDREEAAAHEKELGGEEAFAEAVRILKDGGIVMLKAVGGYQLLASPFSEETTARLRQMKGREKKPFAILFRDVEAIRSFCSVSAEEEALLKSSARPIVLLERSTGQPDFAPNVCGESRYLGAFLPATGIQTMLTSACGPLIATSANLSDTPIPIRDEEAFQFRAPETGDTPDGVYYHEREILRPLDDSVAAVIGKRVSLIRRSRGYVPMPVFVEEAAGKEGSFRECIFAAGADLKSSFCLQKGSRTILSQYLGDLEDYGVLRNYQTAREDMIRVFHAAPEIVACDLHPGYYSTRMAREYASKKDLPLIQVQHHMAHVASVMAEHRLEESIGIAFDGTGYGTDGALWGGEFFYAEGADFERMGGLSPVLLLGADEASRNAAMTAQCYLKAIGKTPADPLIAAALDNQINTVLSSSAGRLFDAVCALLELRSYNSYEAECAIALENAAALAMADETLRVKAQEAAASFKDLVLVKNSRFVISQTALIRAVLSLKESGAPAPVIALSFHEALAGAIYEVVRLIHTLTEEKKVCLSGGVFANRILRTQTEKLLRIHGFEVYWNECVPGNDGGICLGQAFIAQRVRNRKNHQDHTR